MSKSLLLTAVLLLSLAPVAAQDPFGTKPANPFGGRSPAADPFGGGAAAADPFAADPFAGDAAGADPFGQPAQTKAKRSTPSKPARKVALRPGDAEVRIRATLDDLTTASFVQLPLSDAIQQLGQQHNIPMILDTRALKEIGLDTDTPVSLSLRNVTLRSFLRLLLRSLDLTYMIRDEVMQITTQEASETNLIVQTYPFPGTLIEKTEQVITALTKTVTPDQWQTQGGPSTVVAVDNVLVVLGSDAVHEGVVDFLKKLDDAFQRYKHMTATTAQP